MRESMFLHLHINNLRLCYRFCSLLLNSVRKASTMDSLGVPIKPPNILILMESKKDGGKDHDLVFSSIRETLSSVLNTERYVFYPLPHEDIFKTPWRDNCSLLVVSSKLHLPSPDGEDGKKIQRELETYVQGGGKLLSTNPVTNAAFGFVLREDVCRNNHKVVQIKGTTPEMSLDIWTIALLNDAKPSAGSTIAVAPSRISTILAKMREYDFLVGELNQLMKARSVAVGGGGEGGEEGGGGGDRVPEPIDCIEHLQLDGSPGHAILSHVDILTSHLPDIDPVSGSTTISVSEIVALKREAPKVSELLCSILREIGLKCSDKDTCSRPTPTYLICFDKLRSDFESAVVPLAWSGVIEGSEVNIELINSDFSTDGSSVDPPPIAMTNRIVLLTNPLPTDLLDLEFDYDQYQRLLATGHMGRTLLYTSVIGSTQTMLTGNLEFARSLRSELGVVSVAGQQIRGRGRHDNAWLSPKGCMMFSLPLAVQSGSRLHSHLSLLQHIVALSVVSAIRTVPGYQELPVCVKWPNDIYYQDKVKLGGILVNAFPAATRTSPTTAIIGCGVNVCNKYPTMSINDCIHLYNTSTDQSGGSAADEGEERIVLPQFTVEALLALTLNRLERYLSLYEHSGMTAIDKDYYHYWLHSGAVVKLESQENEEVTVKGIDEFGYLIVTRANGEELTLRPDGNSFDIMRNLIVMK